MVCILDLKSIGGYYIAIIYKKAVRRHKTYSAVTWKLSVEEVFVEKKQIKKQHTKSMLFFMEL